MGCGGLATPMDLSLFVHNSTDKKTAKVNNLHVYFGQFLSQDMAFTAQTTSGNNEAIQCCPVTPDNHPQCAPIGLSRMSRRVNKTCINFVRSAVYPTCTLGHRTQINTVTSFIDASPIYGNSWDEMNSLRALDGTGKLLVQSNQFGPLLPPSTDPENDRCSYPDKKQICFRAGDHRVNQNPVLTSMYTIWVREHNRVATSLKKINPHWGEEKIFQETRRVVIAELQVIVMKEYLPLILGNEFMRTNGYYGFYNSITSTTYMKELNPNLVTEFSTAAFRFGHSMVDTTLAEIPKKPGHSSHLLRDKFYEPFGLYQGELDLLLTGASRTPAQALDRSLVTDVILYLHRTRGETEGLDLAAMDIQRGRDHALPSYVDCYNYCNPSHRVESFYDLEERHVMTTEAIRVLRTAYGDVRDVDLYTGILSETHIHEGILGPTGSCILGAQFHRLVFGDRYWFTHKDQAGSFTESQLSTLTSSTTLAGIICTNSNVTEIPWNAMHLPVTYNTIQPCRNIGALRLDYWKESQSQ